MLNCPLGGVWNTAYVWGGTFAVVLATLTVTTAPGGKPSPETVTHDPGPAVVALSWIDGGTPSGVALGSGVAVWPVATTAMVQPARATANNRANPIRPNLET
jgi:hypothetical protein